MIVHFIGEHQSSACGTWSTVGSTTDLSKVTCVSCKRTKFFKRAQTQRERATDTAREGER